MFKQNHCLNEHELNYYQQILKQKQMQILEQTQKLKQELVDYARLGVSDNNYGLHLGDSASSTIEMEKLSRSLQRLDIVLQNINKALMNIERKTYGICRVTGIPIAKERLNAIPETDISIEGTKLLHIKSLN